MDELLWWGGITPDTSIRDIGWTYVLIVVLLAVLARALWNLRRIWRGDL